MISFRTQFSEYLRVSREVGGPSLTIQSAAPENDLNEIVRRMKQGLDPGVPMRDARYGVSVSAEQREASLQTVADAKSKFEELTPEERGETKSFAEYLQSKLTREGGPLDSLDVNGPTDSNVSSTNKKKGPSSETKTAKQPNGKKDVQKGDEASSEE